MYDLEGLISIKNKQTNPKAKQAKPVKAYI